MKAEHTSTRICEDAGNVKALFTHPKLYTSLLQTDKGLVYYDMMALQLIWKIQYVAIQALQNHQQKLCVAFSLDFNMVYVLSHGIIYRIEHSSKNPKTECPRFTLHRIPPRSLAMAILQRYWIIVNQRDIIINRLEQEELTTIRTQHSMSSCHLVTSNDRQCIISFFDNQITLSEVTSTSYTVLFKTPSPTPILETAIDQNKEYLAIMSYSQIDVYCYQNDKIIHLRSLCTKMPKSLLFFHFSESVDAVGRRYQQNIIVTMTQQNGQYRMTLMGNEPRELRVVSTTADIYFNPLFNNCVILRSDKGQLDLVNLYGYDKEWVTLGFRFVHIDKNEMYFEREDDFEFQMNKKQQDIRTEELDDYSYSLLSQKELQIKTTSPSKFRRIAFEI